MIKCIRNNKRCKACNELVNITEIGSKKLHVLQYRNLDKVKQCIIKNDEKSIEKCFQHGILVDSIIDCNKNK